MAAGNYSIRVPPGGDVMRNKAKAGLAGVVLAALALAAAADDFKAIFDGTTGDGWVLNKDKTPLPKANVQPDGLNPHGSGGYIVVHDQPHGDFILDFD